MNLNTILLVLAIIILILGFISTLKIPGYLKNKERDDAIHPSIVTRPFLLNPIFITYGLFALATGIFIFYWYFRYY